MAPKVKVTKEQILAAALEVVREQGAAALNARSVAKRLNCSTQPIFSNYATMEALRAEVLGAAKHLYEACLEAGMRDPAYPPYKASGIAYIRFARRERELFKLLFMRDRSGEEIREERAEVEELLLLIAANTGLDLDAAYRFHIGMWVYVHGIAAMIATSYLPWDEETVSAMLTDAYQGMLARFRDGRTNQNGRDHNRQPDEKV